MNKKQKIFYPQLESMGDILRPKTGEEIIRDLSKLSKEEKNNQLIEASYKGHKDIVKILLKAGADVNAKNNNGDTALIFASIVGHEDIVKILIKAGADVNTKNIYGYTALIGASYNDHKDIVELLLNAGADVNAKNKYGDTALMWASRNGYKDIVEMLKKYRFTNESYYPQLESMSDILRPKTKKELKPIIEKIKEYMYRLEYRFKEEFHPQNPIKNFNYFLDNGAINLTIEFTNDINSEENSIIDDLIYYNETSQFDNIEEFDYLPLEEIVDDKTLNYIIPVEYISKLINESFYQHINENIGGAGGAGYAVYGGGWGRSFGNPSMGGKFGGRGFGFGGSQNLSGGPNLMYTYEVKPLTQNLQQPASEQDVEERIHIGSKIKGHILNTEKEIEGQILEIKEDEDNNIKWYIVLDKEGIKQKIDPTTAYLYDPNELIDPFMMDIVGDENTRPNESYYPQLESMGDIFRPKTGEEINRDLSKLSSEKKNNQLIKASREGHKDIVEILLKAGADVNAKTKHDGYTALMWASYNGHKDIVEILLKAGADVNAKNIDGITALMWASVRGHKDIVEMLLKAGVDVNAKTKDGITALILASREGHKDIVELLKKYKSTNESYYPQLESMGDILRPKTGEEINRDLSKLSQEEKNNQLIKASFNGHKDIVKILLRVGAGVNAKTKYGYTALIRASYNGYKDVVEMLLKAGADVNAKNEYESTALMWASRNGHKDIVELLKKYGANESYYPYLKEELSGSESLYGFIGWLTTRDKPITMSAKHEASEAVELIGKFIKKQNLKKPKEKWDKELKPMKENFYPSMKESLIYPAIELAVMNKKNVNFREFTNKIFDTISKKRGVSQAAGIIEWLEDELKELFNSGKNAEEAVEIINKAEIEFPEFFNKAFVQKMKIKK